MPVTNPAFPRGPYRFFNREYLIITSRTDPDALRAVVPELLEVTEPIVKYEFIRMPDSTGFGDGSSEGRRSQVLIIDSFRSPPPGATGQIAGDGSPSSAFYARTGIEKD